MIFNNDNQPTFFPYRLLLKAINGKINEEKLDRVLINYFKYRQNVFVDERFLFPMYMKRQLKLINIYGMECVFCGVKMKRPIDGNDNNFNRFTVEHILAKSRGGVFNIENTCLSCNECNSGKSSKTLPNFIKNK